MDKEKLVLKSQLISKVPYYEPINCVVEKVIYLSERSFEALAKKPLADNYDIKLYAELMCRDEDSAYCVLFIDNKTGDGILVESEGASYARYSLYIPHARDIVEAYNQTVSERKLHSLIEDKLKGWINASETSVSVNINEFINSQTVMELLQKAVCEAAEKRPEIGKVGFDDGVMTVEKQPLTEFKLYCPLTVVKDDWEIASSSSSVLVGSEEIVNLFINDSFSIIEKEKSRGLLAYTDNKRLDGLVLSAMPSVENIGGDVYGVITVKSYGELDKADMIDLIDELEGQLADGWGEHFEQIEIPIGYEYYYISFWDGNDEYKLTTADKMFSDKDIDFKM